MFKREIEKEGRTIRYGKGDIVIYGSSGVYRVDEIGPIYHIRGCNPNEEYYKLSSVHRQETIYIPVNTHVFMRPIMARQEAEALLDRLRYIHGDSFTGRDPKMLREHYQSMLATHNCETLVRLIQTVNDKSKCAAKAGKQIGKTDQEYRKKAETLLCEELAVALALPINDTKELLSAAISNG